MQLLRLRQVGSPISVFTIAFLLFVFCSFVHGTEHLIFQIFNGVFLKVNKATINMLRRVEPYVAYG